MPNNFNVPGIHIFFSDTPCITIIIVYWKHCHWRKLQNYFCPMFLRLTMHHVYCSVLFCFVLFCFLFCFVLFCFVWFFCFFVCCLFVCLFICLFVCLFVCLFGCLFWVFSFKLRNLQIYGKKLYRTVLQTSHHGWIIFHLLHVERDYRKRQMGP